MAQVSIRERCPWCRAIAYFERAGTPLSEGSVEWHTARCGACRQPSLFRLRRPLVGEGTKMIVIGQYPKPFDRPPYPGVPDEVKGSALEAHRCVSVRAWNAVGTMARRAMQAAALERGAPEGNAKAQIEWLAEKGQIASTLAEVADRIRVGGRDGAHPEWERLDEERALQLLGLMDNLLRYMYEIPHGLGAIDPGDEAPVG